MTRTLLLLLAGCAEIAAPNASPNAGSSARIEEGTDTDDEGASTWRQEIVEGDGRYPLVAAFRPEECWDVTGNSRPADQCPGSGGLFSYDGTVGAGAPGFINYELVIPGTTLKNGGLTLPEHLAADGYDRVLTRRSFGGIGCGNNNDSVNDNRCDLVYPGHWLLAEGQTVETTSVDALKADGAGPWADDPHQISLTVTGDAPSFEAAAAGTYVMAYARVAGEPSWTRTETMLLVSYDAATRTAVLARDTWWGRTIPDWSSTLPAGAELVLAPHVSLWPGDGLFGSLAFNLSTDSEVAPANYNDGEADDDWRYAYELTNGWQAWVEYELRQIGDFATFGVQYDGGRWRPDQSPAKATYRVDTDHDLVADWGYLGGVNLYGAGGALAMGALRQAAIDVGEGSFALVLDSSGWEYYRGYSWISGIEMENFAEAPETYAKWWTGIGGSWQHLASFVERQAAASAGWTALSYGFTKHQQPSFEVTGASVDKEGADITRSSCGVNEACGSDALFRVGFVSDQLLGLVHPYASGSERTVKADGTKTGEHFFDLYQWPEYAVDGDWDWLGTPDGTFTTTPDRDDLTLPMIGAGSIKVCTVVDTTGTADCVSPALRTHTNLGGSLGRAVAFVPGTMPGRVDVRITSLSAPTLISTPDLADGPGVRDRDREDAEYDDEVPLYPFVAGTYVQYAMDSMEPDIYADETGSCAADSKLCRYNRSFVVSFTATGRTDYSGAGLDPAELGAIGRPLRVTALFGSDLTAITHDESITLLVDGTMRRYHVDIPQGLMNEDKKLIGLRFASGEELGTFSVGAVEVAIGTTHRHHRLFHDPDTGARTGGVFLNGGAEAWDVSDVVGVPYEVAPFDAAILRYDGAAWFDVTTGASLSTDTGG